MAAGLREKYYEYWSVGSANVSLTVKQIIEKCIKKFINQNKHCKEKTIEYHYFWYFLLNIFSWMKKLVQQLSVLMIWKLFSDYFDESAWSHWLSLSNELNWISWMWISFMIFTVRLESFNQSAISFALFVAHRNVGADLG